MLTLIYSHLQSTKKFTERFSHFWYGNSGKKMYSHPLTSKTFGILEQFCELNMKYCEFIKFFLRFFLRYGCYLHREKYFLLFLPGKCNLRNQHRCKHQHKAQDHVHGRPRKGDRFHRKQNGCCGNGQVFLRYYLKQETKSCA